MENLPNMKMECGATVIHFTPDGYASTGTVIAAWGREFVTWRVYLRNEVWHAEVGHYFNNILDASKDYYDRLGVYI